MERNATGRAWVGEMIINEKRLKILKLGMNDCGVSLLSASKIYECNISNVIKDLVDQKLIEQIPGQVQVFKTTEKGKQIVLKRMV